jgi:hypothetical protein
MDPREPGDAEWNGEPVRRREPGEADWEAEHIRRRAERIVALILYSDLPLVDIDIERAGLRREVKQLFPDRMDVYERIYESRFRRIIEQWRPELRPRSGPGR